MSDYEEYVCANCGKRSSMLGHTHSLHKVAAGWQKTVSHFFCEPDGCIGAEVISSPRRPHVARVQRGLL